MGCRSIATALTVNCKLSTDNLLKCVLAQALAAEGEVFHVAGHLLAEVLVHINLGEVLAEHEAVATQAREQTDLRVDDVTR